MKTKITVEIHRSGTLNDAIVRMVTNHNEGKVVVYEDLIRQRCHCYYAEWVNISPTFEMTGNNRTLEIKENEKPTITLRWKEVIEAEPDIFNHSHVTNPETIS